MKAIGLCASLVLARLIVLIGHPFPASAWSPLAFVWQDLLLVLLFLTVDRLIKWPRLSWTLYALLVLYTAFNIPLQRIFSTPLTWPMARAARGPLAGSICHYVTWENCCAIAAVIIVGIGAPLIVKARPTARRVPGPGLLAAIVALTLLGPYAGRRIDTGGLHHNPVITLFTSSLPHVSAEAERKDWSRSPFGGSSSEDLSLWRGSSQGRNVILIVLESTGARHLAPYGAPNAPMPSLTALARDSILFENAYCVYPESIKGLFSLLCSQYPAFDTQPEDYAQVTAPSLAQVLSTQGYQTALFHSGRFMYLGMESIIQNRGYGLLEDAGDIGGNHRSSFGVDEASTVNRMLDWVDSLSGATFFLTYLPIAGHHPYSTSVPGPFLEEDEAGRYLNALHEGDAALGTLLEGLKQRKLFENTLLVLCGDHGEAFGEHPGNFGHTMLVYEENVRVPLLFVAPGVIQAQQRVARLASLIDVTPTVLDLLGFNRIAASQGQSLLAPRDQMVLFYTDYAQPWVGLRDGQWKFVHELGTGRSRLFDLSLDPAEADDLSSQLPDRVTAYRAHTIRWSQAQKANILSWRK